MDDEYCLTNILPYVSSVVSILYTISGFVFGFIYLNDVSFMFILIFISGIIFCTISFAWVLDVTPLGEYCLSRLDQTDENIIIYHNQVGDI